MRRGILAMAALALAGCAAADARDNGAEDVAVPAPAPAVAVAEASPPAPFEEPSPPVRTAFSYSGELTQGGWIRGQVPTGTTVAHLGDQQLVLDDDGRFFAAFDRDAGSNALLVATMDDGRTVTETVPVSPRAWDIEHVNVARRPGGASESFMRRRQPELDAIWDARTANSDTDGWKDDFIWPVSGRISGRFGSQRVYRGEPGSYHSGLDIARPTGTEFVAPASGVVTLATTRPFSLEGYLLIIDHGQGLNSAFLHLSRIDVSAGDRVEQGQTLGAIGSSGRATGPHLHWSIKWHLARLDPLLFVGPMP